MISIHVSDNLNAICEKICARVEAKSPLRRYLLWHHLNQGELPRYDVTPDQTYVMIKRSLPRGTNIDDFPAVLVPEFFVTTGSSEILVPTWELAVSGTIVEDEPIEHSTDRIADKLLAYEEQCFAFLKQYAKENGVRLAIPNDRYYQEWLSYAFEVPEDVVRYVTLDETLFLPGDSIGIFVERQGVTILTTSGSGILAYEDIGMVIGGHVRSRGAVRFLDVAEEMI